MGKINKKKKILKRPCDTEWPRVDPETEEKIFTALAEKLREFPNLDTDRKKEKRRKAGLETETHLSHLTVDQIKELKLRLRRQLLIGQQQVCKALEHDEVAYVMVSGDAEPPILLRSLLPLVVSRGCPGLCLSSLTPRVSESLGVQRLLALGFKKYGSSESSDFKEFVEFAVSLSPPLSVPWFSHGGSDGDQDAEGAAILMSGREVAKTFAKSSPVVDWPIMEPYQEEQVLDKLIPMLKPYEAGFKKMKHGYQTSQWRSQRRIVKIFTLTDVQGLRIAALSNRLDLLLVQHDRNNPHPILTSAVKGAIENGCPVLHMTQLKKRLVGIVRDDHFKAIGFKKKSDEGPKQPEGFQQFIAMASLFAPWHLFDNGSGGNRQTQKDQGTVSEEVTTESTSAQPGAHPERDTTTESGTTSKSETTTAPGPSGEDKNTEPGTKEHAKKPDLPVYDVHSLYMYKTDQDRTASDAGTSGLGAASSGAESYISLSSEPTVQLLGMKAYSQCISVPETASVDNKGDDISMADVMPDKALEMKESISSTEGISSEAFTGVMGLDSAHALTVPQPLYPEPGKSKPQAAIKRKLDDSAEKGEFISFKFRPTDVGTVVPNPNRKKNQQ